MTKTGGNNYPNPLDNFRSYSYHFVLTAASTTEAFRTMTQNSGGGLLSAVQSKQLGEEFTVNGQRAFLIVDTRRYSQYTITDVEFQHIFGSGDTTNPSVPTAELKMTLVDTTGLSFFNFMMDMMRNKLQTTRASAFFLLSIIFVGHNDDGTTETVSTCHVPLILLLMGFTFDHRGSVFNIEFMEMVGAPQRGGSYAQMNNLGTRISTVKTPPGRNTVGAMIEDLEDQLNFNSLQFYQKYVNEASSSSKGSAPNGKLVQYMITLPKDSEGDWSKFELTGTIKSVTPETDHTAQANQTQSQALAQQAAAEAVAPASAVSSAGGYSQMPLSPTMPITDVIKLILEASKQFRDLASTERLKSGRAKAFRTVTTVTSDETSYIVHFDILPYYLPKSSEKSDSLTAGDPKKKVLGTASQVKNVITYDYIFSGFNSHITDLKIEYSPESVVALDTNLDLGQSRMSSNAGLGQTQKAVKDGSQSKATKTTEYAPLIRAGDPIFMPVVTKAQADGAAGEHTEDLPRDTAREFLTSKQEYSKTWANIHFTSSLNLEMDVRGNPNIIRKYGDSSEKGGVPPHTEIIKAPELANTLAASNLRAAYDSGLRGRIQTSKAQYINDYIQPKISAVERSAPGADPLLNGIDPATLPVFVKLNIFAPNVDWTGNFLNDQMFSNEFFFNGPYQILMVQTKFSGGDFTHHLSLIPYVVDETDEGKNSQISRPTAKTL